MSFAPAYGGGLSPVFYAGLGRFYSAAQELLPIALVDGSGTITVTTINANNGIFDDIYVTRIHNKTAGPNGPDFPQGLTVSAGGITASGGVNVSGGLNVLTTGLNVGAGGASVSGGLFVTSGGLTVSAAGAAITGNSSVTGTLQVTTGLTVNSGGVTVTGASSFASGSAVTFNGGRTIAATGAETFTGCSGTPSAPVAINFDGNLGAVQVFVNPTPAARKLLVKATIVNNNFAAGTAETVRFNFTGVTFAGCVARAYRVNLQDSAGGGALVAIPQGATCLDSGDIQFTICNIGASVAANIGEVFGFAVEWSNWQA